MKTTFCCADAQNETAAVASAAAITLMGNSSFGKCSDERTATVSVRPLVGPRRDTAAARCGDLTPPHQYAAEPRSGQTRGPSFWRACRRAPVELSFDAPGDRKLVAINARGRYAALSVSVE